LSVDGGFEIAMVTATTAGLPLGVTVSIMIVPEWLPGSSVVGFTVTVSTKGDRPDAGVTESQPWGFDAATACMVWLLIEAGRVTVTGCDFGMAALFTWYAKLKAARLAVGPDWAAADQQ
jgi:hypothetical protein